MFIKLRMAGDLIIVFGDAVQGDAVRELVAFGDSLGIPAKYICLVDYSNSRGAFDMGLIPKDGGMSVQQMLAAKDLVSMCVQAEKREVQRTPAPRGGGGCCSACRTRQT